MPFVHIVLSKVKADIMNGNGLSEFKEKCNGLNKIEALKPLLLECVWGSPVYEDRAKGWNWGLYTKFSSKADFESYRDHPDHKDFSANVLRPNVDDIMAYDLEY